MSGGSVGGLSPSSFAMMGSSANVGSIDTLWKRVQRGDGTVNLFTSCRVTGIEARPGAIAIKFGDSRGPGEKGVDNALLVNGDGDTSEASESFRSVASESKAGDAIQERVYDYAICTVPLWNINEMELTNFTTKDLSTSVKLALDISHWIRSAKVFVALKEPFWKQGDADPREMHFFPQVMSTSSILRDVYGLVAPTSTDPYPTTGGVALISYTWEDDAQKFMAYESADLVKMMLKRVEELFAAFPSADSKGRHRRKFSEFMLDPTLRTPGSYSVWQWSKQPSYHGCAKAYQTGIENLSFSLLTHNSTDAQRSRLYFAGDAYSMESGWMEPAQRMSVDAVLNLLNHDPDTQMGRPLGFDFECDYLHPAPISSHQSSLTRPLGITSSADHSSSAAESKTPLGEHPSSWNRSLSSASMLKRKASGATSSLLSLVHVNGSNDDR